MKNPFEQETRERWGDSEAFKESKRRTGSYGPEQVRAIKEELESIESRFAALLEEGSDPQAPSSTALAEEARQHIDRWYYPCPPAMHVALAEMYLTDARFKAHYDDRRDGLAEFVAEAIRANSGT